MTIAIWTYDQYLAAVFPRGVAAKVVAHKLADGFQIGRIDGVDDWLDQSEDCVWEEDLAMRGPRPEEWYDFHHHALAEIIDEIKLVLSQKCDDEHGSWCEHVEIEVTT